MLRARLHNQRLTSTTFRRAEQVVSWLGAVQAQDYPGARWALGLRARGLTSAAVDDALARGKILRTHILRPTWHFVAPGDIRWMQMLTAPRVQRTMASYARHYDLDAGVFRRACDVIERALDGRELTRAEISQALAARRIPATHQRLAHILMHAELEQVITSGGLRGNQFTYARLEARAPKSDVVDRDDALARLTERYFASHGPATIRDMAWWSGLPQRDVVRGLEIVGRAAESREHDDRVYWSIRSSSRPRPATGVWLLPNYDEFLIAYRDRRLSTPGFTLAPRDVFAHFLVIDGVLAGVWRRSSTGPASLAMPSPYRRLTRDEARELKAAADRFRQFH